MCEFCDVLTQENYKEKEIVWNVRSTFADDNIEEVLESRNYEERWIERDSHFKIYGYQHNENSNIGIEYKKEIESDKGERAVIWSFTESVQFNYCPMCGKQISKEIEDFGEKSKHSIYLTGGN